LNLNNFKEAFYKYNLKVQNLNGALTALLDLFAELNPGKCCLLKVDSESSSLSVENSASLSIPARNKNASSYKFGTELENLLFHSPGLRFSLSGSPPNQPLHDLAPQKHLCASCPYLSYL